MENQSSEDKLAVLQNIFGNDLTDSLIAGTLKANNDAFDPTVEKLLTLPANKVKQPEQPPQQQPQPMDPKSLDNIKRLHNMFGDLTQSVITTVYESNKRDVEGTVDTLLNLTSNEVASGARKEAEIARQEQELKAYEEFKKAQQRLQEEERRQTEIAQQNALQRAKEEEQRRKAVEEAQKKAELERKAQSEHVKALLEQERMLLEFQRKKAEEEAKRQAEVIAKEQERQAKEKLEKEKARVEQERAEKERANENAKERLERLRLQARKLEEEKLEKERIEKEEAHKKIVEERRLHEERLAMQKLAHENELLQKQNQQAEAERKLLEARMKEELQREEEERKKFAESERRFREEQENIRRTWEEKVRKLESERRLEEQKRSEEEAKRAEAKRQEDEERARQEADMRRILELERLKLDEQRKRIEEEKKSGEARLRAMEEAALLREEEEAERLRAEEERKREEEERARLLQEEAEARERIKEDLRKAIAQEQFTASAILVPQSADEPKVDITAECDGTDISGSWVLVSGILPPQAWLGLFPKRAINTNAGYAYISGKSGEFNFKGLTPGHYEVRVFSNKPVTTRIAESAPLLVGPKVVAFNAQHQGGQLMLEYTLDPPASPSSRDWVGIYEKSQRRNQNYTTSGYGHTTGMISIQVPRTPGVYEARLFVTGAKYNDQAAIDFTVEDHDRVTGEVQEGVIKASWVMRTVETTGSDWIGLFATGEASNNKYLASVYTSAASEGSVDIPLPKDIAKGLYELRLFSSKVGKYVTFKTSDIITIN